MLKKLIGVSLSAVLAASMVSGAVFANAIGTDGQSEEPIAPAAETQDEMSAYLFVHFVGNESNADQEQIYFSLSKDGTNWVTLNDKQPVMKSNVGEQGVRDPNIIRKPDGSGYYVIATDLSIFNIHGDWGGSQTNGSRNIVVWESEDLVTWSDPWLAEIARDNATCTWAPEVIWDAEREAYMVYWASKTKEDWYHRVYRCYTEDFHEFTAPEVYIEAEESRIDTTFIKEGDTYYRFTKDEHNTYVYMEKSNSLSGDFTAVSTYRLNGQSHKEYGGYEGPTIFKLNGGDGWCLLLDNYGNSAGYKPFVTDDISKGDFYSAKQGFNFNGVTFRHGTVMPITTSEFNALMDKWGQGVTFPAEQKPEANKPQPDPTTGEVIYALDFEENLTPTTGTQTPTSHGEIEYVDGYKGGKAIKFDKSKKSYLQIDGSMLAGKNTLTISFAAKISGENTEQDGGASWLYFIAPNADRTVYGQEKYLGATWRTDNRVKTERYNGSRLEAEQIEYTHSVANDTWAYITVVYAGHETRLYINGELKATKNATVNISDLLGATPVMYLGYATWESGEYAYATLDCFKIYNYPLSNGEVAELYNTEKPE